MFWGPSDQEKRYIKAHNRRQREQNERRREKARKYAAQEREQERQKREAKAKAERERREAIERNRRHEEKERRRNEKLKARRAARKERRRPQLVSTCSSKGNMSSPKGCSHYYYELDGNKYYCRNGPGGPDAMPAEPCSETSATWGTRKAYNP